MKLGGNYPCLPSITEKTLRFSRSFFPSSPVPHPQTYFFHSSPMVPSPPPSCAPHLPFNGGHRRWWNWWNGESGGWRCYPYRNRHRFVLSILLVARSCSIRRAWFITFDANRPSMTFQWQRSRSMRCSWSRHRRSRICWDGHYRWRRRRPVGLFLRSS
jgi:hypothetical protein